MTSILLVVGAMTMTWICDTISESGFGKFFDQNHHALLLFLRNIFLNYVISFTFYDLSDWIGCTTTFLSTNYL